MNIDWRKAPKGTTGAVVANFESISRGGKTYKGKVEFIPFDEPRRNCYAEGPDAWTYYPAPAPWNGEGLPPVGTWAEIEPVIPRNTPNGSYPYVTVEVLAYGEKTVFLRDKRKIEYLRSLPIKFYPIRTPEQIAEEELKHSVNNMIDTMCPAGTGVTIAQARVAAERLYAAGYRKFEIVDEQP